LATGGAGALLVSPLNVELGCYVWTGYVEESEFCLFMVVFPVRLISSISPRFYFKKHTFCFFSLVTILEYPYKNFCINYLMYNSKYKGVFYLENLSACFPLGKTYPVTRKCLC
jgi:hypothetical protein